MCLYLYNWFDKPYSLFWPKNTFFLCFESHNKSLAKNTMNLNEIFFPTQKLLKSLPDQTRFWFRKQFMFISKYSTNVRKWLMQFNWISKVIFWKCVANDAIQRHFGRYENKILIKNYLIFSRVKFCNLLFIFSSYMHRKEL